ncbi:cysteine desulfurase family protein [Ampullimonas aquatilis]|uniref:cysteine desulfurase family protein n=1 Tax=Ampullimonas aquatilis TaxID=1341549 RepID=UPI003C7627C0
MSIAEPIYLDNNATTRPYEAVISAMSTALAEAWANPSSTHPVGQVSRKLMAEARGKIAAFLGCQIPELVFTSCATEANDMALMGALERADSRKRLVISAVEHAGMMKLANKFKTQGVEVDFIPVLADGSLDMAAAQQLIQPGVTLVSVMAANNETGIFMPIAALAELCKAAGVLLHVDATQALGKTHFHFASSGADLVSLSAHKIHGPKGVGALIIKKGVTLPTLFPGSQERTRRGGTENLPGIIGFAAAIEQLATQLDADITIMQERRDALEAGLTSQLSAVHVYGQGLPRLPNTSYLRFGRLNAELVLNRLEQANIMASSGSACSAATTEPSHVLTAMGVDEESALAAVRFSVSAATSAAEIDHVIQQAVAALAPLLAEQAEESATPPPTSFQHAA